MQNLNESDRSRQDLSNEPFIAKERVYAPGGEPLKVSWKIGESGGGGELSRLYSYPRARAKQRRLAAGHSFFGPPSICSRLENIGRLSFYLS